MRLLQFGILLAFLIVVTMTRAGADQVPNLNVAKSCRAAQNFGESNPEQTYKNCMLDEQEAKAQLAKKWAQFKLANRRSCIAVPPSPSYVEMLTCLEMNEQTLLPYSEGIGGGAPPSYDLRHDSPSPRPAPSPGPRGMRSL